MKVRRVISELRSTRRKTCPPTHADYSVLNDDTWCGLPYHRAPLATNSYIWFIVAAISEEEAHGYPRQHRSL